jgi:hypothetical protein
MLSRAEAGIGIKNENNLRHQRLDWGLKADDKH